MMSKCNFVKEWDTEDLPSYVPDWAIAGRKKLNKIIKKFNNWQIEGFDYNDVKKVLGHIEYAKQTLDKDGGEYWHIELDKMETFIKSKI